MQATLCQEIVTLNKRVQALVAIIVSLQKEINKSNWVTTQALNKFDNVISQTIDAIDSKLKKIEE
jgi:hypothetical protein